MQGKTAFFLKKLALEVTDMYKFSDNQIKFSDFGQPVGMKMNPNNRWVKKAECIPWNEIELRYAQLFTNRKGNVAKPLHLALGACIIQKEYGFSDEEIALQIQENPYLQFFCGFTQYKDEIPFDPSLMVYFRKRLTPEILGEINELIITKAQDHNNDDNDNLPPQNNGTLIVDATCAPSLIKYPQDTELLNEARENTENMIDELNKESGGKRPRTYRKKARKQYLSTARKKKKTSKEIRKSIRKQLSYLERNLKAINTYQVQGSKLSTKAESRLETINLLYQQQKYMYDNHTHKVENRIVSLSQPYLRPIVRGKAKAAVEFGAKLDISVANGFVRLEKQSFDAYNEAMVLTEVIERYKSRTGSYPSRVLADKIYRNRDNIAWCKERNIRLSGPALGRPRKDVKIDKKQEYRDNCDRVEVERDFSLAKRKCGLGQIVTRLKETTQHSIALSIVVLNLRKVLYAIFQVIWNFMGHLIQYEKSAFVQ